MRNHNPKQFNTKLSINATLDEIEEAGKYYLEAENESKVET